MNKNIRILVGQSKDKKTFKVKEYYRFFGLYLKSIHSYRLNKDNKYVDFFELSEEYIINDIQTQQYDYYTLRNITFPFYYNLLTKYKNLTKVYVKTYIITKNKKNSQLITVSNDTTKDNINNLPSY